MSFFDVTVFNYIVNDINYKPNHPLRINEIVKKYYDNRYRGRIIAEIKDAAAEISDYVKFCKFRGECVDVPTIKSDDSFAIEYFADVRKYYIDTISPPTITFFETIICILLMIFWPIFVIINYFVTVDADYYKKEWKLYKREYTFSPYLGPFTTLHRYKLKQYFGPY